MTFSFWNVILAIGAAAAATSEPEPQCSRRAVYRHRLAGGCAPPHWHVNASTGPLDCVGQQARVLSTPPMPATDDGIDLTAGMSLAEGAGFVPGALSVCVSTQAEDCSKLLTTH